MSAFTQRLMARHERMDKAIEEAVDEAASAAYLAVLQNDGTRELAEKIKNSVLQVKAS
jgi:hypothetical protein